MPNLKLLTKDIAEEYALEFDHLLYDYELIEDEAAEVLGKLPWFLWLNGLIEISEKSAEHLAKSPLGLNIGVPDLSNAAATALSKVRGWLQLNELTYLSEGVCERLGHHQGWLCLHGLKSLSFSNAQLLSRHRGILCFGEDFKVSESVTKILDRKSTRLNSSHSSVSRMPSSA